MVSDKYVLQHIFADLPCVRETQRALYLQLEFLDNSDKRFTFLFSCHIRTIQKSKPLCTEYSMCGNIGHFSSPTTKGLVEMNHLYVAQQYFSKLFKCFDLYSLCNFVISSFVFGNLLLQINIF